jgi:signal transduction histidine kinase
MTESPMRQGTPASWRRVGAWPTTLFVLVLSLLATLAAWQAVARSVLTSERTRFDNRVAIAQAAIVQRLETYSFAIRGAAGLFAGGHPVDRADFRAYVANLRIRQLYPGIQGLGYTVRVPASALAAHEAHQRDEGFPGYAVRPAGPRPEYHAIIFLEPLDWRNQRAIGFDMSTAPARREAMARARDTGEPAMSGKVTLVQETREAPQAGFLIYYPVYRPGLPTGTVAERRRALLGFTYAPFRAGDLFAGIFAEQRRQLLGFQIYDGPAAAPERLLYEHLAGDAASAAPAHSRVGTVVLAGRPWTIRYASLPEFESPTSRQLPPFVLGGGLAVSLLLAGITWVLGTGRARAEGEVERRTAALEAANAQLRETDRYKDEFLSVISHELRTPLNFITGFASILEDEVYGALTAPQQGAVRKILDGADRMLGIVDDLLDFARMQAGKFQLTVAPTAFAPLAEEVAAALRPLADGKDVAIETEVAVPDAIPLDGRRVVQVLTNLVGNAIKFTERGGRIRIRAAVRGARLRCEVADEGVGIAPEDLPKLFTRFSQLDMSSTREAGGTGLGLAISKSLVEAHGGTIGAESEGLGRGATFWFELPAGTPGPQPPNADDLRGGS